MKRIAVTLVVLLVTLFMFVGVTSSTPYDAWYDFDDDGDIDIYDIVDIAGRYGTTGTPINKTELLLDLQSRVASLEELVALLANGTCIVEGGKFDGDVQADIVETDPGAEAIIDFASAFTTLEKPVMFVSVVMKGDSAPLNLNEGAAIKAIEDVKGAPYNWVGFDITVTKHSGGAIIDGTKVFVTWIAIGRAPVQGASPKECMVVTGSKPYNAPISYTSGTGFVINVSNSIPSGFTLVSAFATGRKTDLGGTTLDEPPLNLLPRINGTSIEIRVWDAGGTEYNNWSSQRAHIDYTLFITK